MLSNFSFILPFCQIPGVLNKKKIESGMRTRETFVGWKPVKVEFFIESRKIVKMARKISFVPQELNSSLKNFSVSNSRAIPWTASGRFLEHFAIAQKSEKILLEGWSL